MTARPLHHIALGAHDVDTVAAFYRDWFGLRELTRHHTPDGALRSVWLDLDGSILMVERSEEPPRRVTVGAGPFLLAFTIADDEHAAFEARLASAGIAVESRSDFTSYFRDPEGNRVAVSHFAILPP